MCLPAIVSCDQVDVDRTYETELASIEIAEQKLKLDAIRAEEKARKETEEEDVHDVDVLPLPPPSTVRPQRERRASARNIDVIVKQEVKGHEADINEQEEQIAMEMEVDHAVKDEEDEEVDVMGLDDQPPRSLGEVKVCRQLIVCLYTYL